MQKIYFQKIYVHKIYIQKIYIQKIKSGNNSRSRRRQMEIKAALTEASRSQEAQFALDWQQRLKQLKAEEVSSHTCCSALCDA